MATQSEIKYNRLMKQAEGLFLEQGYRAVSMDQIAEAAGISKMTIYKHFPSKEALFIEVILSLIDRIFTLMKDELEKISGTLDRIDFLMNYSLIESKKYSIALYQDILSLPYITDKIIQEKVRLSRILFEKIIREGVAIGEVREGDVGFMTDMLMIIIEAFGEKYMNRITSKEDIKTVTANFYDFLKYGLIGRPGVD